MVLVLVNLYFLVYWAIEFLKAKSDHLLENKYCAKYCSNVLKKLATFEWKRSKTTTEDHAHRDLSSAFAEQTKDEFIASQEKTDRHNASEQCRQNQAIKDNQESPPEEIYELEADRSNITLGESDYSIKKIRKSMSIQNEFFSCRPFPLKKALNDISNNITLGESDYSIKKINKSSSIHTELFRLRVNPSPIDNVLHDAELDASHITLGDSDYRIKKIRKSTSFHGLLFSQRLSSNNQIFNDIQPTSNNLANSMYEIQKSNIMD